MITTKTGDDGKSRWMGKALGKDSKLLEAVGTIDELQALLQIINCRSSIVNRRLIGDLFGINGELSCGIKFEGLKKRIEEVEDEMEKAKKQIKPITDFVIFNTNISSILNLARTVCRRAERRAVSLDKKEKINKNILVYLNRLSDYLFILSLIKN